MTHQMVSLKQDFLRFLPKNRIFTDPLYTLAKGTDAGFYRLIPQMVVRVENEEEMVKVIQACSTHNIPLTFKAGGTSLSGQTITGSVLVEVGDGYSNYKISPDGRSATFQCGLAGGLANRRLAPYGRKLGPSPASLNSARIGGIVANNASGSSYGIKYNSYNTIRGLRLVMADGTLLDTRQNESREAFAKTHEELLGHLSALGNRVKQDDQLRQKIEHKYELKNTCGYGVNSLIDFSDPIDILEHLMVGSEGTLGFISEVTFETVPEYALKATSLLFFPDIRLACEAITPLRNCSVSAAELMDRNALRSVQDKPGMPPVLKQLPEEAVALLIDTSAGDEQTLHNQIKEIESAMGAFATLYSMVFTTDTLEYNRLWKVRKGLFTSAAASRAPGTACIIEDLAFRAEVLAEALVALKELIEKFEYEGYVIWGHLLDGNIHFVMMPDFNHPSGLDKYRRFMEALVQLVVHRFDGSLKAEHGTGRNMAPFVREEWGEGLYEVMREIKTILDPRGLLNPGVIINEDSEIHLKNLKPLPVAHQMIDTCIECGFCEINCPSKNVTLTPRQRIVIFREMEQLSRLKNPGERLTQLKKAFNYHGEATCATDGLCELACPVEINTGKLVKELRFKDHSRFSNRVAWLMANNMGTVSSVLRHLLIGVRGLQKVLGNGFMGAASRLLYKVSFGTIPLWNPNMPSGTPALRKLVNDTDNSLKGNGSVVYFPTCINRTMGASADYDKEMVVVEKTIALLRKAGFNVVFPSNLKNLCCGMAFDSKGFKAQGAEKARQLDKALLEASQNGKLPVYCDMSPCLLRMKETLSPQLNLYEPVGFMLKYFPGRLEFKPIDKTVALHSTCSNTKMELDNSLVELARMCVTHVVTPDETGCCGWAGDRGFTHPQLNASALKYLKKQLPANTTEGYSTSRTCEIGLTWHGGISYKSIVYLVDEATHPLSQS